MKYPKPPSVISLDNILPDEPLLMMGAGPVPIPHKVAYANSVVINHLGDTMNKVIDQVKVMSRYVFQTSSSHVMGVSGPASAAMEMAIVNLVEPGHQGAERLQRAVQPASGRDGDPGRRRGHTV